jgi:hypothetical protein
MTFPAMHDESMLRGPVRAPNRRRRNVVSGSADFSRQDFLNRNSMKQRHIRAFTRWRGFLDEWR